MNPADYLDPSDAIPKIGGVSRNASTLLNTTFYKHGKGFPSIDSGDLVVVGFPESRNSSNKNASKSPDLIREFFYSLSCFPQKTKIIDAGNLKSTKTPKDTYSAIKDLTSYFLTKGANIIVLGGTQEVSYPIYQGIKTHRSGICASFVDSRIDMDDSEGEFCSTGYIKHFIDEPLENLFNLSIIGYQGYLCNLAAIDTLSKKNHELLRLGFVRGNYRETEPTFRDSDLVSFDIGAIRNSDCPGNFFPSPNGLYAEEACQLARYAGLSDRTCCFGVFELNTENNPQGAHLSAQLVWHFIDAYLQRKFEKPNTKGDFKKFIVEGTPPHLELVFYKSDNSDSWWLEVPSSLENVFPDKKSIVACSHADYIAASKHELPDKWLRIYNKIN